MSCVATLLSCLVALTLMWQPYICTSHILHLNIIPHSSYLVCMLFAIDKRLISLEHAEDTTNMAASLSIISRCGNTIGNAVIDTRKCGCLSSGRLERSL